MDHGNLASPGRATLQAIDHGGNEKNLLNGIVESRSKILSATYQLWQAKSWRHSPILDDDLYSTRDTGLSQCPKDIVFFVAGMQRSRSGVDLALLD